MKTASSMLLRLFAQTNIFLCDVLVLFLCRVSDNTCLRQQRTLVDLTVLSDEQRLSFFERTVSRDEFEGSGFEYNVVRFSFFNSKRDSKCYNGSNA